MSRLVVAVLFSIVSCNAALASGKKTSKFSPPTRTTNAGPSQPRILVIPQTPVKKINRLPGFSVKQAVIPFQPQCGTATGGCERTTKVRQILDRLVRCRGGLGNSGVTGGCPNTGPLGSGSIADSLPAQTETPAEESPASANPTAPTPSADSTNGFATHPLDLLVEVIGFLIT